MDLASARINAYYNPEHSGWHGSAIGDINGDGKADLVFFRDNYTFVYISTGSTFNQTATVAGLRGTTLADVNGDGKDDLITFHTIYDDGTNPLETRMYVRLSTGSSFGGWSLWNTWYSGGTYAVGDVDGDGREDVVFRASLINSRFAR
ncbi:MAG: hypothetical protein Kow006_20820 [Gammaproteobacteria bacterium]